MGVGRRINPITRGRAGQRHRAHRVGRRSGMAILGDRHQLVAANIAIIGRSFRLRTPIHLVIAPPRIVIAGQRPILAISIVVIPILAQYLGHKIV